MTEFTHIDNKGNPSMVDVGEKQITRRSATARSIVKLPEEVLNKFIDNDIETKKGPVFQTAIIAGIMAAKKTGELIPLCHSLALENCEILIAFSSKDELQIDCTATTTSKTGVEMEALVGASLAALTVYDMCKALSHDIVIKETKLMEKTGGKRDFKEHNKHTNVARPHDGFFCRNEWAIIGTACDNIKNLAASVIAGLTPLFKCGYADASHKEENKIEHTGKLADGAVVEYIDQLHFQQAKLNSAFNQFHAKELFSAADLVLVNGNHFQGKAQVLVIDEIKKESLKKRIGQLNNVQLIILNKNSTEIFDFIKDSISGYEQLPVYHINELEKIVAFFTEKLINTKPILNGLVLAGGKSIRMGFDKSNVNWHGKEQKYFMADMLANICNDVFISCRNDQEAEIGNGYKPLKDTFTGLGPYGAILSAFRDQPDVAWMVVACDLPLLNMNTLKFLEKNRNVSAIATAFQSPYDNLPEPLITIWEPRIYPILLRFLSQGFSCPRKVLINNNNVEIINAPEPFALKNVNTPDDMDEAKNLLKNKMAVQSGS